MGKDRQGSQSNRPREDREAPDCPGHRDDAWSGRGKAPEVEEPPEYDRGSRTDGRRAAEPEGGRNRRGT
ncbi:hypothetical protein GCM10009530_73670 [Microbispora corallina]|uniref:Uncharacterized protein n=1 Tax=Microbispora corallina TaxID=83302 RepID=A0ABQ4GAY1_9ACTN|nr:hypothetical protein Mco01_72320 [Microbispora corallina]